MDEGNNGIGPGRKAKRWFLPITLLASFAVIFVGFFHRTIVYKDSFHFFAPYKFLIGRALGHFTLYEWNPWQYAGLPFAAEAQAAWFYPLNLLFLLDDFGVAHRLYILLHYPLAAGAMYLFLRGRKLGDRAAGLGGFVFALSGYLISQHGPVRMLMGAAWAPLAFFFLGRALVGSWKNAAAAGAVVAMQVLAGDPETALVSSALGSLWLLADSGLDRRFGRGLGLVLIFGAAVFGLAAIQVLPTAQMLSLSNRRGGLPLAESLLFSLHPAALLELVWPTPYGTTWPEFYWWGQFTLDIPEIGMPWSFTNYLGLPAVLLALIGWAAAPGRRRLAWGAGFVLFLLLSLGRYTPVYGWVHAVTPVFNAFRYPEKFMAGVTGFLAVAAAFGFHRVIEQSKKEPNRLVVLAGVFLGLVLAGALAGLLIWPGVFASSCPYPRGNPMRQAAWHHLWSGGIQAALTGLAFAALLFLIGKRKLSPRLGIPLLAAVIVSDLWIANVALMPRGPADRYESGSRAAAELRRLEPAPTYEFRIFRENLEFRDRNPELPGASRFDRQCQWLQDTLKRNLETFADLQDAVGYGSYEMAPGADLLGSEISLATLELLNVKYLIVPVDYPASPPEIAETVYSDPRGDFAIIRLNRAWPRAYWAGTALPAASEAEARELMAQADLRKSVVITSPEPGAAPAAPPAGIQAASIREYEPDRVVVEVTAPARGWLVLNDRFYPGWTAKVDSVPSPIFRANVMVRAVKVGPGAHRVEFSFCQPWLRTGAAVSGISWLGALILLLSGARRRSSHGRRP